MREQLEQRRAQLETEHTKGQQMLAEMRQQCTTLEQTLLRISGAIQLCNEVLTQPAAAETEVDHGVDN